MTLTPNQLHVLQHSLGCDKYGRGAHYRNRYVCDPEPDLIALCSAGLMLDRGAQAMAGGMHCYSVTDAGKTAMREQSPVAPRLTRSQQRYREWLAYGLCSFEDWLKKDMP